ncbi:hypothetical protein U1Q18_023066 [Sarracenia purpurea var. burkii]
MPELKTLYLRKIPWLQYLCPPESNHNSVIQLLFHDKDFVVLNVRQTLFETISSFHGNLEDEKDLVKLIEAQFAALQKLSTCL